MRTSRHMFAGIAILASTGVLGRSGMPPVFTDPKPLNTSREQARRVRQMERAAAKTAKRAGT